MPTLAVSDCCQAPIRREGILLYVPDRSGNGTWCVSCGLPCLSVFPSSPTQEEWDKAFLESKNVFDKFMDHIMGVKLCPAHALRIHQLCDEHVMNDFPKNPGRKDETTGQG